MELASFADLDDALLEQVASHLPLEDLCRACRVCSRLRAVIMGAQEVWRILFEATYGCSSGGGGGERGGGGAAAEGRRQAQQAQPQAQQHCRPASTLGTPASQAVAAIAAAGLPAGSAPASAPPLDGSGGSPRPGKRRREGSSSGHEAAAAAAAAAAARAASGLESGSSSSSSWRERFKSRFVEDSRKQRLKRQARRIKAESALQVLRLEVHRLEQALAQEQRQLPQLQAQLAALQTARRRASAAALAQVYWQPVAVQQAHGQGVAAVQQPLDAEGAEQDLQQRVAVSELEVRKLAAALQAARRRAADARRKLQALQP